MSFISLALYVKVISVFNVIAWVNRIKSQTAKKIAVICNH